MKKIKNKTLSFFGGVIIVGAAVAALIATSPKLRAEIERQSMLLLKTTREAVAKGQDTALRLQRISSALSPLGTNEGQQSEQQFSSEHEKYDAEWAKVLPGNTQNN